MVAERAEKAARKAQEAAQTVTDAWTVRKLGGDFLAALKREGKRPRTIGDENPRWMNTDVDGVPELPAAE